MGRRGARSAKRRAALAGLGSSMVVLAVVGLAGCANSEPSIAAYVGADTVTTKAVDSATSAYNAQPDVDPIAKSDVLTVLIHGELAEQIAAQDHIEITDAQRAAVFATGQLASLLEDPNARPLLDARAEQQIVYQKIGESYWTRVKSMKVTVNPRYGVINMDEKIITRGMSGSLAKPETPAPSVSQ